MLTRSLFFCLYQKTKNPHVIKIEKDGKILMEGNTPSETGASQVFVQNNQAEIFKKGNYKFCWNNGKVFIDNYLIKKYSVCKFL